MNKKLIIILACFFVYSGIAQNTNTDSIRVFSFAKSNIEKVKSSLKHGEKTYDAVYKNLLKTAKKLLKDVPPSVITKNDIPPSGDKHDYMSYGPYFWPNPDTKDGLPYINRDGEPNPENEAIQDHHNFTAVCVSVFNLSLAYYFSDDEAYAKKAVEFVKVWFLDQETKMNPNLNFAQAQKGKSVGRGAGIVEGRWLVHFIDGLGILESSQSYMANEKAGMQAWLSDYLTWLQTSKNGKDESKKMNNHGTWYDVQVMSISLYLNKIEFAKKFSDRLKTNRIDYQITPEGKQPEELKRTKALGYSFMNLQAIGLFASLTEKCGINYWNYESTQGASIKKAIDYLYPYVQGEKVWEYQQIKPIDMDAAVTTLLYAARIFNDEKYVQAADKVCGQKLNTRFELLYL